MTSDRARRNRSMLLRLLGVAGGAFAFGFALVPLYDVLCDITGIGNSKDLLRPTSITAVNTPSADPDRRVMVEFVAELPTVGSWEFSPVVYEMQSLAHCCDAWRHTAVVRCHSPCIEQRRIRRCLRVAVAHHGWPYRLRICAGKTVARIRCRVASPGRPGWPLSSRRCPSWTSCASGCAV